MPRDEASSGDDITVMYVHLLCIELPIISDSIVLPVFVPAAPDAPDGSKWERNLPPPPHVS